MKLGCVDVFWSVSAHPGRTRSTEEFESTRAGSLPSSSVFPLVCHKPRAGLLVIPQFAQGQGNSFAFQKRTVNNQPEFWKHNEFPWSVSWDGEGVSRPQPVPGHWDVCSLQPLETLLCQQHIPTVQGHWDLRKAQQTQLIKRNSSSKQQSPASVLDFASIIYSFSASH